MEPLWISVFGWSGTGKTTLIVRLAAECARRGLSCACAKRARHPASIAPEGKDSSLFLQAGALASAYVGDSGAALFLPPPPDGDSPSGLDPEAARAYYECLLPRADVVILEGAEARGAAKILVTGEETEVAKIKRKFSEADIIVARDPGMREKARTAGRPAFGADMAAGILDAAFSIARAAASADGAGTADSAATAGSAPAAAR